ncbi:MAG: hypothetical protein KGI25_05425, partial [Thaumarchaeota archaeon]|nr:hypothetical protein [Nitrososphaerota archaeon]
IEFSKPFPSTPTDLISFSVGFIAFLALLQGLAIVSTFYFLRKFKKLYLMKYYLHSRFFSWLLGVFAYLLAAEIHLSVSSRFKGRGHSALLNKELKKRAKEEISAVFR